MHSRVLIVVLNIVLVLKIVLNLVLILEQKGHIEQNNISYFIIINKYLMGVKLEQAMSGTLKGSGPSKEP